MLVMGSSGGDNVRIIISVRCFDHAYYLHLFVSVRDVETVTDSTPL